MSTNAVPLVRPTSAYSLPVCGSVQPQMSLPAFGAELPGDTNVLNGRFDMRSTPSHEKPAALPPTQAAKDDWAEAGDGNAANAIEASSEYLRIVDIVQGWDRGLAGDADTL
jgi:hypothetical protein